MEKMMRKEKKQARIEQARKLHEQRRSRNMKTGRRGPHGPGGGPPGMPADKAEDFRGSLKKLIKFMNRHKVRVLMVWAFAVASTVFSIIGPKIMGKATTELFTGLVAKIQGTGEIQFDIIGKILIATLAIYGISSLCSFIQMYTMSGISQNVAFELREAISHKIHRLPLKYFESRTTGEVLSRITNDVDTLGQSLNQALTQLITSVTTIIGVAVMMLSISPLMTLITLIILPVSVLLMMLVVSRSQTHFINQQKYLGEINGQVEEIYSGQTVVKVFNREASAVEKFEECNDRLYESAFKSQFLSGLMQPIMQFVGNLGYVAVAVSGAILAAKGRITVGDIQAFIQYVRNFTQPIQQLAQVSNQLQSMVAAAERVFEFLEEEEEVDSAIYEYRAEDIHGKVDFEHVRFGYTSDKTVINDWSASVKPGQTVAIVGPTGAGKTTMVKLLMHFYDLDSGRILIDDRDISGFDRHELRSAFGMVLQDTWLFKGSIMENIRYGKLDATDEEVVAAAKAAHADRFIRTLPGGYSMELNEDATNISQGQKQLITITRAILADKPILILDEATSSVDTRTEHAIQKAMDTLMAGRTSFVIAHRLSTIRNADVILVMKEGDIIEQGTHDELIALGGFYAELYNSQFEDIA
ncbi:MAG: ABC transporter ATP-binding protein [Anaerovoracaceae bacterium]|nr:ABC transporter ATP-binding protein [Anaerovoracaceae bacterium]